MNNKELQDFWVESSNRNFETMLYNFKGKQYTWCLFLGHLVLEKLLKALYVKNNADDPVAPRLHNLIALAEKSGIKLDFEINQKLGLINSFNQEARYETAKQEFYKQCTKEFAEKQVKIIKELREWLKELIKT